MFKYIIKISILLLIVLAFIPLLWFCGFTIMQAIHETDYLAVVVLGILALMLVALAIAIIFISLEGDNDGI
jgi:hypothetical protein